MPGYKRYHPVSHNFNRDPEIIEARKTFGDWIGYAWQECLAIGDRNDGVVPGTVEQIADILAPISLQKYHKYAANKAQTFLKHAANLGWIRIEPTQIAILKYRDYHRKRGTELSSSEPSLPNLPKNHPKKDDSRIPPRRQTKSPYPEDFKISDQLREWCVKQRAPNPDRELEAFRDFHIAKGSRFHDWNAAFRTWIRNSFKFNRGDQAEGEMSSRTLQILRRGL